MKRAAIVKFLTIVLTLYGLINYYVLHRGWEAIHIKTFYKYWILAGFLFLVLAYPVGRLMERRQRSRTTEILVYIGAFYLPVMVYLFFITVFIDLLRMGNSLFHYFPSSITSNGRDFTQTVEVLVIILTFILIIAGHINSRFPRVRRMEIYLHKPANRLSELNMVVVSDIHLGTIIHTNRLEKIVKIINDLQPDLVLIPGDIVDEDVAPQVEHQMTNLLQKIHSRYGVFAVTGNHEYFGGVYEALRFIEKGKVTVLQDSAVKVANAFYIIGRRDQISGHFGEKRKPLKEILEGVDGDLPLILMDHQPLHLEEAQQNGIDLQLSGHTHHGQMFPFNLLTKRIYEVSWGYLRKGNTQYYVSCEVGTWGPPVRLGSVPEIVHIRLMLKNMTKSEIQKSIPGWENLA